MDDEELKVFVNCFKFELDTVKCETCQAGFKLLGNYCMSNDCKSALLTDNTVCSACENVTATGNL